jgi:TRAP-type mannitol/chloroaromatic compound transport system permease small subunit
MLCSSLNFLRTTSSGFSNLSEAEVDLVISKTSKKQKITDKFSGRFFHLLMFLKIMVIYTKNPVLLNILQINEQVSIYPG